VSRPDPRTPPAPRAAVPRIRDVPVAELPIRLGQFLKLAAVAEDGVHARHLVEDGAVQVNGRVETRRGAQLKHEDVVAVGDERVRAVIA
jgi:ribosome-associated protein